MPPQTREPTDWSRLGGADGVAALMHAFVQRVVADPIIGFFFEGRDISRVTTHEIELASRHLGGPTAYTGRRLDTVHKPLRIHRGHFRRRLALLRTVLHDHAVPEDIVDRWVGHDARLEGLVTVDSDCDLPDPEVDGRAYAATVTSEDPTDR